ncbi:MULTISPECIES: PAS domain-containing sensor histidine kinase [Clostridium]|uniref:PAS domain-containing sensor histidine kinase n=1 Tax=Clostridium TaxID=1485 RepID=UPI00082113ED|nr:ATP-binding protein [Clostridium saudiense]MDU7455853.1 ATP-binding protein [Clostridium saudiense]SCK00359.1 Sensor protein srrB [uncultured Clostridium sp.]
MVNYKDVFRKIPKPVLFIKYELNKDKNTTMKIEFINDEALSFFNKTSDELIHKDFFDVLPEFKDDKNFINRIESIENDNIVCTKYIRSLVNFISITIQKIDEKYFAFYLEHCIEKKIFDEINELGNIFFIKDRENRYMYSSDLYNEYEGHPNLDMYGLTDFDVYSKENGDLYFNAAKTFIDSKQPYSKEISTLNNTVYILNRYSIYSNGEVIGIIGIFESVIGKLEKIYDGGIMTKIVNDSLEHIIFKDMNGVYLDCNDSFLKDLKLKREDVIGKSSSNIYGLSEIEASIQKSDLEVIKEKKRKIYNEEITIDGQVREFEVIKEPFLDSYKNLVGIIVTGRDVTHRREIEKMQQEFFANISHELRTPLNLIFGSLQLIKSVEKEVLEKRNSLNKYIDIIDQNSKRLLRLVDNLIDSTRMKCGYYEYNPKNYDIVSFVENISMSVADFAKQNNIDLIFDTNVEEKIMAFDLEKLERIMLNLLSNSIKYNKAQGQIEVLLNDCNDTFVITVKDTGVGIPSDKLMYIFERFRQVENRFNKSTEGSGIGLSLVKDLIEIQGGTIEVKSELGVGSEFIIKLPVKILSDDSNIDKVYFNNDYHDLVKRMNIEFSDIYIGND